MAATTLPATTRPAPGPFVRSGESQVLFESGRLAYRDGQFTDAEADFNHCINLDSRDAQSQYYLGLTLTAENRLNPALSAFNAALQLDPTLNEARAGRAAALIRMKQFSAAQSDISALAADPAWADTVAYLNGQLAYAQGNYKSAASSFAQARASGGDEASAAGLYEGLSYVRSKEYDRAQAAFRDIAGLEPDSAMGAESRATSNSLDANTNARPFTLKLSTGFVYDSNVTLLAGNSPLPAGTFRRQDGRFVVEPQASVNLYSNNKLTVGVDTTDYFAWQLKDHAYDIASYDVGAFGTYAVSKTMFAGLRYDFNDENLGSHPALKRNLLTPQFTIVEPGRGYTTAFYQFEARQFDFEPATPQLDEDGKTNVLGLIQGLDITGLARPGMVAPRVELGLRYENDQTKGSDFAGNFFTLSGSFFLPINRKWIADAGIDLSEQSYNHVNSLDDEGREREDREVRPHFGLSWQATRNLALRGDYIYTYHGSNIESGGGIHPYQFSDHQLGVRVIFTY